MPHFPMFVDLKGRRVLVAGGGKVALRKIRKLLPYGARITVAAPEILSDIAAIPSLTLLHRAVRTSDLRPRPALVIAATDSQKDNRVLAAACRKRGIPVNVADDPDACTFLFPALVQRGSFSAGISTGGASPAAAAHFRAELEAMLPDRLEDILVSLEKERHKLKETAPQQAVRASVLGKMLTASLKKGAPLDCKELDAVKSGGDIGSVSVVGAGCGSADLITVRGMRLLRGCQAVVYDDLIDSALLDLAPESAERIYVGKRSGSHSAKQEEINGLLISLARRGLSVVRLKGGDPYVFGRGGEEMAALKAAGITCTEVPGITSAVAIPAEAGIPVTHRGLSRGVHIVTLHGSGDEAFLSEELKKLAPLGGTLVFLMGLSQLEDIAGGLIAEGKPSDTPAAVISGGNAKKICVRAPLCDIAETARRSGIEAPAVIVVGAATALDVG